MLNKIKIYKFFLIVIATFFLVTIFSPSMAILKTYFSSEDIHAFLALAKNNDEIGITNLNNYFHKKKEKDNLKYLGCYIQQQKLIKYKYMLNNTSRKFDIDFEHCPKNPLSYIKDNVTWYDYFKYKISFFLPMDSLYFTSDGKDGTGVLLSKELIKHACQPTKLLEYKNDAINESNKTEYKPMKHAYKIILKLCEHEKKYRG